MISTLGMKDKQSLYQMIESEVSIINNFINTESASVEIHINRIQDEDYGRSSFALFGLSLAYRLGHSATINSENLISLYKNILNKAKSKNSGDLQYVLLYGIRLMKNLNQSTHSLILDLKATNLGKIYSYPVLTYIYMSAYMECEEMQEDEFLKSINDGAVNVLEYILYSSDHKRYLPFHFAELSYSCIKLEGMANKVMNQMLDGAYMTAVNTSGVAKCLEHYTRVSDALRIQKCVDLINSRSVAINYDYLRPDILKFKNGLYRETGDSNYICLDTNTHLLLSYLNLYAKL
jgi:hypothetical protein